MGLKWTRRVRGNLHGSIDISQLEDRVIAHPAFQRLRRIRQTAFLNLVFPGATHSRFEHSLGAMHLAGVAFNKIVENQKRIAANGKKFHDYKDREQVGKSAKHGQLFETFSLIKDLEQSDYVMQALRLAALMHDIGHPPFSHSGERFLPSYQQFRESGAGVLPDYIHAYIASECESLIEKGLDPHSVKVRHEIYTLALVDRILSDVYHTYSSEALIVSPRDVVAIIEPKIRPESDSPLEVSKALPVCSKLVSGEVDIDRMDYLLRDSKECGVVYGNFDKDRILDSLAVYYSSKDDQLHLAIQYSGLAAFEDYLRARQSMFLQLYFHKTSVAGEAMLQHLSDKIQDWHLPIDPEQYIKIDEYNIGRELHLAIEQEVEETEQQELLKETLDDLILHRRLWKRVYEFSDNLETDNQSFESVEKAENVLKSLGIRFQKISSKNQLTKFINRDQNSTSSNYLRLIKKDAGQFPRVEPIEDYSSLFLNRQTVHIQRLYSEFVGDEETIQVKKAINQAFLPNDC